MQLHLFEKFILLALDQKKGKFLIDSLSLNYGIAGAILLELSELNKIISQNKRIKVSDEKLTNNTIIDTCIKLIKKSKKNQTAKYWIYKIGYKSSGFKKIIINDLHEKGVLKIEKKTYIWRLVKLFKYQLINLKLTEEIKTKLKKIVFNNEKPEIEALLLLSLMNSCKLIRILFVNKSECRFAKKRINELTMNIEISETVSQTLKEIQTAIIVATTSTFISSFSN